MSQEFAKRDPLFPGPAFEGTTRATHKDPGDMINGIKIPGKPAREEAKRTKASGRGTERLQLCPICGEETCCYTIRISS
jgi:hypothetical protein